MYTKEIIFVKTTLFSKIKTKSCNYKLKVVTKLLKTTSKPQECVCETCLSSYSCYFHATSSNAHLSSEGKLLA